MTDYKYFTNLTDGDEDNEEKEEMPAEEKEKEKEEDVDDGISPDDEVATL